jgi:uncharacterized membrane protein (DUF485 family)
MRSRYSIIMAIVSAAIYYGFILLVAFDKELLAKKVGAGVTSLGVPLGVGVIVFTIVLTWIYVRRANTEFDATNEAIIKEAQK